MDLEAEIEHLKTLKEPFLLACLEARFDDIKNLAQRFESEYLDRALTSALVQIPGPMQVQPFDVLDYLLSDNIPPNKLKQALYLYRPDVSPLTLLYKVAVTQSNISVLEYLDTHHFYLVDHSFRDSEKLDLATIAAAYSTPEALAYLMEHKHLYFNHPANHCEIINYAKRKNLPQISEYLIFDLKIDLSEELKDFCQSLKGINPEYNKVLDDIRKRELFEKIEQNLSHKANPPTRMKI